MLLFSPLHTPVALLLLLVCIETVSRILSAFILSIEMLSRVDVITLLYNIIITNQL